MSGKLSGEPCVQGTAAREVGQQILHLISKYTATFKENVFGIGWPKWNRQQLGTGLFGCASCLVIITTATGCHHVGPDISPTLADGLDVVAGELIVREFFTAIQTQMSITPEESDVVQRRNIIGTQPGLDLVGSTGSDNAIDFHHTVLAGVSIYSAM